MEEIGEISPDSTHLIEVSSGSSGISLSIACKELGYPLTMILPEILPIRRVEPMIRNGASIIYSKGYVRECIGLLKRKLVSRKFFYPNHSEEENDIIVKVFKRITAEIYNQAEFDYLISGIGNGSSTVALFDFIFKTKIHKIGFFPFANSNKIVYGLYGQNAKLLHVERAKLICDEIFDASQIDLQNVKDFFHDDTEIQSLGESSLMGVHYALDYSRKVENKRFVSVAYDSVLRY